MGTSYRARRLRARANLGTPAVRDVEYSFNAFFRYKTIVGDRLRARREPGRKVEARIACDVLNRMTKLGRPESVAIRA